MKLLHILGELKSVFVSNLLKNNQVKQIVKFLILSMSYMHVCGLSRPGSPC